MKLKLNLNVDSVKRLLIQHGEKAAFGLAMLVLALFFWKTLRMEVLGADKQPEMLAKLADQTRAHVLASQWDPKAKNFEPVDYPARAEHVDLVDNAYRLSVFFDKPLWEQHDKRSMPKLWPVEELLAASGQGIFAVKKEAGDDGGADIKAETRSLGNSDAGKGAKLSGNVAPRGYFYVAVTGLLPLRKQTAEYDDAFRSAQKYEPAKDVPLYEDMKVEAADVTDAPNKLAWQEINLEDFWNFESKWPSDVIKDVVDSQYIDEGCTLPLGPLLGEDWDPAVAGHPKIPLAERFDKAKKNEKKDEASARRQWAYPGTAQAGNRSGRHRGDAHRAGRGRQGGDGQFQTRSKAVSFRRLHG